MKNVIQEKYDMISVEFTFEDGTIKKITGSKLRGIRHRLDRPIKAVAAGLKKYTEEYNDLTCAMKIGHENNIEIIGQ